MRKRVSFRCPDTNLVVLTKVPLPPDDTEDMSDMPFAVGCPCGANHFYRLRESIGYSPRRPDGYRPQRRPFEAS